MRMIPKKETLTIEFKSDVDSFDEKELISDQLIKTFLEYCGISKKTETTG